MGGEGGVVGLRSVQSRRILVLMRLMRAEPRSEALICQREGGAVHPGLSHPPFPRLPASCHKPIRQIPGDFTLPALTDVRSLFADVADRLGESLEDLGAQSQARGRQPASSPAFLPSVVDLTAAVGRDASGLKCAERWSKGGCILAAYLAVWACEGGGSGHCTPHRARSPHVCPYVV